jgi:peptidoglycan/LPS O-acetylase OafA/YrhL
MRDCADKSSGRRREASGIANGGGRDELPALTALRGIAAWWVVLYHMRPVLEPHFGTRVVAFLAYGNLAVDLFFLLSGFVIYLNYAGRIAERRMRVRDFLFRRFSRIYPLHFVMLLAWTGFAAAAAVAGSLGPEESDPAYLLASYLLVQNWGVGDQLQWNVPAWSISTEAFAYLLFPALLALLAPWRRQAWALAAALAIAGMAVHFLFWAFGLPFPDAIPRTGLFRCVVQFAMGMGLCELYRRLDGRTDLARPLLAASALLGCAFALGGAPVVPLAWAALILGLALGGGGALSARPLVYLGTISYATYLSHYLAYRLFKIPFMAADGTASMAAITGFWLFLLLLSAGLYHVVERPAQRRLNRWWDERKARPARASG